jgi:hypothetical protein
MVVLFSQIIGDVLNVPAISETGLRLFIVNEILLSALYRKRRENERQFEHTNS